ncbi:hypothetical protein DPSP01_011617 [Paraphaeosphaeria sporulosa]|uniref:Zn(2)-C6 fungal-type domain-containing protein n=1 Tax=Paraphaeosphaeria sporulosa TaxID=1460663 RepID=A0A177CGI9_9PLEO|nr:uncharacterized protein CC84DRAFT_735664 [Paraphaeosphaeria sporulosa]OAG05817.1 hypothetical protein CC84DRAFT_735664 [Paraphaeosphaeria sporulosa]
MDQHCWGCRKRRVVCDLGKPGCAKCKRVGVECPGYGKQKPLQWLEVGKVKCREKKKRPGVLLSAAEELEESDEPEASNSTTPRASPKGKGRALSPVPHGPRAKGQLKVEAEVEVFEGSVPSLGIKDETTDIVQAVFYYNKTFYPNLHDYYQMSPSSFVVPVPPEVLYHMPAAMRHTMVTLSLCYQLYRKEVAGESTWPKILVHRGSAIQDLNKTIGECSLQVSKKHMTREQARMIDTIIASVIVFVSVEVLVTALGVCEVPNPAQIQYCASMEWRHHIEAMSGMIATRGGLTSLWHDSPSVRASLLHFTLIQNFSASTSPVTPQTQLRPFNQLLSIPEEMHEEIFSYCLCPFPLFESIAFINRLRIQLAQEITNSASSAEALLWRIESFSASDWAASQTGFVETLELAADIWHCAVLLYCMLSLEKVMPATVPAGKLHRTYGDRLLQLLSRALSETSPAPRVPYFIVWPVTVAGVEAVKRGPGSQSLVDDFLTRMSRQAGTCSAFIAQTALRAFWASGQSGWDRCFYKPYALQC